MAKNSAPYSATRHSRAWPNGVAVVSFSRSGSNIPDQLAPVAYGPCTSRPATVVTTPATSPDRASIWAVDP